MSAEHKWVAGEEAMYGFTRVSLLCVDANVAWVKSIGGGELRATAQLHDLTPVRTVASIVEDAVEEWDACPCDSRGWRIELADIITRAIEEARHLDD